MSRFSSFVFLLAILSLLPIAGAQYYWFQAGAKAQTLRPNSGAGISIETVSPQNVDVGSFAFWVGEELSNKAFVQVGYFVPNATGFQCSNYSPSGCTGSVAMEKGVPTWFWEYFTNTENSSFMGALGGSGSVGPSGTFNNYHFVADGNLWEFYLNGNQIGSVSLGSSNSGPFVPLAYGEYANAVNNSASISPVQFKNFTMYYDGAFHLVPEAFAFMGYGTGSETTLPNPLGVEELNNSVNDFDVGSGFQPARNNSILWSGGYNLRIISDYGNISHSQNYSAGATIPISAPQSVNISPSEKAIFEGWVGTGAGSYTGNLTSTYVDMFDNINETALWGVQYLVNVTSEYGFPTGGGWYSPGSTAYLSAESNIINAGYGDRALFNGWSDGVKPLSQSFIVEGPTNISAVWETQYLVNVTSPFGTVAGSGWYNSGTPATLEALNTTDYLNGTSREVFNGWSNGATTPNITMNVTGPIILGALYQKQDLVSFVAQDNNGNYISASWFGSNNSTYASSAFLAEGRNFSITYVYYKNTTIATNTPFHVSSPETIYVKMPVYGFSLTTTGLFGEAVNASVRITFKNGSSSNLQTGNNGVLTFADVPYGYSSGVASYFIGSQAFSTSGSKGVHLIFITPLLVALTVFVVLCVCAAAFIIIKRKKRG